MFRPCFEISFRLNFLFDFIKSHQPRQLAYLVSLYLELAHPQIDVLRGDSQDRKSLNHSRDFFVETF